MEMDFVIQDTFAATSPQWKIASTFEEAGLAFAESVKQNYRTQEQGRTIESEQPGQEQDRTIESEQLEDDSSSDGEADDEDPLIADEDDAVSSEEENDADGYEVCSSHMRTSKLTRLGCAKRSERKWSGLRRGDCCDATGGRGRPGSSRRL